MNAATPYRWLTWTPEADKNIPDSPGPEPTKPTKPSSVSFVGSPQGKTQNIQVARPPAEPLPDPFGPLPADPAEATAESAMRDRLRQPKYARIIAANPGAGSERDLMIRAAAIVWAAGGPEGIARRRAEMFRGIPAAMIRERRITFRAPARQPGPGEWCGTPQGNAEVLAWRGTDFALVRLLAAPAWRWLAAKDLGPVAPLTAAVPLASLEGTVCPQCLALFWTRPGGTRGCDCGGRPAMQPQPDAACPNDPATCACGWCSGARQRATFRGRILPRATAKKRRGGKGGLGARRQCPCGGSHDPCALTGRCGLECSCSLCMSWRASIGVRGHQ